MLFASLLVLLCSALAATYLASAPMVPGWSNLAGLTPEDVWHLVRFVQSLPYHTLSQPGQHVPTPTYQRERM